MSIFGIPPLEPLLVAHKAYAADFGEIIVVEMAKGICIHARILVESDEGWANQQIGVVVLHLNKSPAHLQEQRGVSSVYTDIIETLKHRMVE